MICQNASLFHQLRSLARDEVSTHGVGVSLVAFAEKEVQTLCLSIGEVEIAGGLHQVNERHVFLLGNDLHGLYVVHRMVFSGQ